MLRFILLALLATTLVISIVLDTSGNNHIIDNTQAAESNEDYGCIHEDHSQYDDGDSLNLNYLNDNYSDIATGI